MNLDLFHRWTGWLLPRFADHLWQSTLLGLTALLVVSLLHRQSARLRHTLLLLGMAKFLVPSAFLVAVLTSWESQLRDCSPRLLRPLVRTSIHPCGSSLATRRP
jgi:hypothetical protein